LAAAITAPIRCSPVWSPSAASGWVETLDAGEAFGLIEATVSIEVLGLVNGAVQRGFVNEPLGRPSGRGLIAGRSPPSSARFVSFSSVMVILPFRYMSPIDG
jgi:hypothetical protein